MSRSTTRVALWSWIGLVAIAAMQGHASAQMQKPQPIDTPITREWRDPFAGFLRGMGIENPVGLLDKTFMLSIGLIDRSAALRVEHAATCFEDQCLTVIGKIADGRFVSEVMFVAGKRYTHGDHGINLFGRPAIPGFFVGDAIIVTVYETTQGWLLVPGATPKDDPLFGSAKR